MSDELGYDEDQAVKFIRATLPEDKREKVSDDEILYVIDVIWEWYEKNGYLDINADVTDEEEVNESELVEFVIKEMKRAKELNADPETISLIVKGELQYEESIDSFI
ncbi:MAG: hypothetical protein NC204_04460 [Candidatus Amulumruptor caecigallinarius]|nr:hypothetical protein [Candidatus Amulumruptor caecigallinarius]